MALHDLDIADKHLVLLPTTQQFQIQDVVLENGMHFSGFSLSVSGGKGAMPIGGSPLKHGAKQTASVEICFGGGQPLEGQPIMPTLKSIARTVNSVLDDLKVIAEN
jgi:hypothetical protein